MATRAIIGYIDPSDKKLISTYNHYDGYPENLGVGLENFYNEDSTAKEIASVGYISFLEGETGKYDSKFSKPPKTTTLPNNFEDAVLEIANQMADLSASYGYFYNPFDKEWLVIKNQGISKNAEELSLGLDSISSEFGVSSDRRMDEEENIEEINEYNKRQWQHRAGIIK
jgi:hypothetical protein